MNDFLLELGKNPSARRLIRSIGLPLPLPEPLRRERGATTARPLADRIVVVGGDGDLAEALAGVLPAAGADPFVAAPRVLRAFGEAGEAYGRPSKPLSLLADAAKVHGLVFDATKLTGAASLRELYDFFHPLASRVARSGRVVVLGATDAGELDTARATAQAALEGFVRSLAKELGKTGVTVNLVRVEPGAEARLGPVLRFLLSARSAFVTAQPLVVSSRAREVDEPPIVRALERKIALVTGAARGIGAATARALAAEGAHVLCLDRPEDAGATALLARELGGTPVLVDVTDEGAQRHVLAAVRTLGGLDVLVHNAGVTRDKTLARMDAALWDQVVGVNLEAAARLSSTLDAELRTGGRVVCLSSIAGLAGNVGQTAYAASKAGFVGFVRAEAERLAARGITVNAIAPGFIETRLTAAIPAPIREVARRLSALGQGGLPEDVAQAIAFVASPGARGLTGCVLRVCGGAFVGA